MASSFSVKLDLGDPSAGCREGVAREGLGKEADCAVNRHRWLRLWGLNHRGTNRRAAPLPQDGPALGTRSRRAQCSGSPRLGVQTGGGPA